jgi:hypothetical protein
VSKSRRKGTAAESLVVAHLNGHGYPQAERRSLSGALDKGDIVNGPEGFVLEVKAHRTPHYQAWLREAEVERANADADYGVVVHKPHGVGPAKVGDFHVVMSLDTFLSVVQGQ